jgi:coenzyme Q-binding protein COQ10
MRHHVVRTLAYTPEQLLELVADVKAYPDFIPWITGIKTWNQVDHKGGVTQFDAEATISFSFLTERFATRVLRDRGRNRVQVSLLYGPFRSLSNIWEFEASLDGTTVDFIIDFEFKTRLLDGLLKANMSSAVNRLMQCFEDRADALYGATTKA